MAIRKAASNDMPRGVLRLFAMVALVLWSLARPDVRGTEPIDSIPPPASPLPPLPGQIPGHEPRMRSEAAVPFSDRMTSFAERGLREDVRSEPGAESRSRLPLSAYFDEGFTLESPSGDHVLRIRSLLQTDFKLFVPGDQDPASSGLYIPRFRLYFEGHVTRPIQYELSLQRSLDGVFDLLDGNVNFRGSDGVNLKFGRFLVPYSFAWYDHLEQYFIAPERGLYPLNFGLARQAGLMLWGSLLDDRVQYAVAGTSGHLSGVADNNYTREASGYLNIRPFGDAEEGSPFRFFNIGGSISGGQTTRPTVPLPLRTSVQSSENDEGVEGSSAVFLAFNQGAATLGSRFQGAVHLAWYYKQWSLEAEWQAGRSQSIKKGRPGRIMVPTLGYDVTLSNFLTGEEVRDRSRVEPLRPFRLASFASNPGAIEVFARYSQLNLGEVIFTEGLANPDDWSRTAYMTDIGWNWYLNKYVKIYFDWQHCLFGSPVLIQEETGKKSRVNDLLWVRCQLYF